MTVACGPPDNLRVVDDRDWSWLERTEAPAAVVPVERVLWRVVKDTRAAEARIRLMGHGCELVITVGAELLMTTLYRDGEAAELAVMSTGIRQTFEGKGWQLQPADEPERERH